MLFPPLAGVINFLILISAQKLKADEIQFKFESSSETAVEMKLSHEWVRGCMGLKGWGWGLG